MSDFVDPKDQAKLDALEKRLAKLKARRDAERSKLREKRRRLENKRKILLGALLMQWMESDDTIKQRVDRELPRFLTRNDDRKAFGLEPLETTREPPP